MRIAETDGTKKKHRPSLQLVQTTPLHCEHADVGSTTGKIGISNWDAAAAVGLHPYQSQLKLWMTKVGRDAYLPKLDPNDETTPAFFANLLAPIVASLYTRRTGNQVRKLNAVLQYPATDMAWMHTHIDREVVGASDVQLLHIVIAGEYEAALWREGIPAYCVCQCQHQLAVTGKAEVDVCVLICGTALRNRGGLRYVRLCLRFHCRR